MACIFKDFQFFSNKAQERIQEILQVAKLLPSQKGATLIFDELNHFFHSDGHDRHNNLSDKMSVAEQFGSASIIPYNDARVIDEDESQLKTNTLCS